MITARQSTARTFIVGPALDADGVAVTTLAIGDFKISKNGAAPAALNGSATLTHRHTGHYSLAATATDLNTVGQAEITLDDTTNACPPKEITVIEEAVYDALFASGATGLLPANVTQFGGTDGTFSGGRPEVIPYPDTSISGSVDDGSPSAGDFDGDSGLSATDDFYNGSVLVFTSGANQGIARKISDYTGSSKRLQFTGSTGDADAPFPAAPSNSDTFLILGRIG